MLDENTISALVLQVAPLSDRGVEGLTLWAHAFVEAHEKNPGQLSVEVGTRAGGSALLFLKLLEKLYPSPLDRPCLWTVDPYGSKPYESGKPDVPKVPVFTDQMYTFMKTRLAPYPNHAHWLMTSHDFFVRALDVDYWRPGKTDSPAVVDTDTGQLIPMAIGERRTAGDLAFCLLDGDHDASTICDELEVLRQWMARSGIVVVDNIDCDPETRDMLTEFNDDYELVNETPETAVLRRLGSP